jgi:hypothetical protein
VDQSGFTFVARHVGQVLEIPGQGIDQGAGPVLMSGVDYHTCRFVNHHQVSIFIHDIQRDRFRYDFMDTRRHRQGDDNFIQGMNPVIGFDRFIINPDEALFDGFLNLCPRNVGQPVRQEFINAHQALTGIGHYAMVFVQYIVILLLTRYIIFHEVWHFIPGLRQNKLICTIVVNSRLLINRQLLRLFPILSIFLLYGCKQQQTTGYADIFESGVPIGHALESYIHEASGMAASRKHRGMFWVHNDSGDQPRVFLIDSLGKTQMIVYLPGARNRDWEDMAAGPGPDASKTFIYIADIGDNLGIYQVKTIYRFPEPELLHASVSIHNFDSIRFVYPDGARDAETLLIDPSTRDLFILSKREKKLHLYRLPFPQSTTEIQTADLVASDLTFNLLGEPKGYDKRYYNQITGGDISADGTEILIRYYSSIYYWKRRPDEKMGNVLRRKPLLLTYQPEPRGEAIAFSVSGDGYYTLSEQVGSNPSRLMYYRRMH